MLRVIGIVVEGVERAPRQVIDPRIGIVEQGLKSLPTLRVAALSQRLDDHSPDRGVGVSGQVREDSQTFVG